MVAPKKRNELSKKRKAVIIERDGYRCQYCGLTRSDGAILEVDHKVPRARGGSDRVSNLITSCRDCNRSKRDKPLGIPPLKPPQRFILNADGSKTVVWPRGYSAEQAARDLCGTPGACMACGGLAMNRVVWTSPHLVARENKRRSIIYPMCDGCAKKLFVDRDESVCHAIDEKLIPAAERAKHIQLIEAFDIFWRA